MWDPRSYQDTDYGLDGAAFEPADAGDWDDVDLSQPHIMTVLGAITPDDLGVCLPHEHILRHPVPLADGHPDDWLDRLDFASEELESFVSVGGRSIVDATLPNRGRDLAGLRAIAQRVPAHLIATAGLASKYDGVSGIDAAAAAIRKDLAGEIKPGVISFDAKDGSTPATAAVAQGAAQAALATGYPLVANSGRGGTAHAHLDMVESAGLDLARVIASEFTRFPGFHNLLSIVQRGAWVSLDWIGQGDAGGDTATAELLVRLAGAGYAHQLLMSQGLSRRTHFAAYGGGPGWTYLIERFTLLLMEASGDAGLVRALLIENPARALTIAPSPAG